MDGVVRHELKASVTAESYPISKRIDGSDIAIQTIRIEGGGEGPCLLLNCGTHGDEPEGHSALLDLVDRVDPGALRGTVIGITALNYPAYEHRKRGNPLDDWYYDLNRIFPGSPDGSITQRIAHRVCADILPQADLVLDLHSGGANIYVGARLIVPDDGEQHLRLAQAMGPDWPLLAKGAGARAGIASFTNIAAELGKPCVTIELGGANHRRPEFYTEDVRTTYDGIVNVMRAYDMLDGQPRYADEWVMVDYEPLRNTYGGLIRYASACRLMASVTEGTLLMTIVDALGRPVEELRAPFDMIILSVPGQPFLPSGGAQVMTMGRVVRKITRSV